jgi:hypothetical protein
LVVKQQTLNTYETFANKDKLSIICNPNPTYGKTTVRYHLPVSGEVRLSIYDVYGREVKSLLNQNQQSGSHFITFDGEEIAGGTYFCRLQIGDFTKTTRLVLIK